MANSKSKRVRVNHIAYDFGLSEDDIRLILSNTEEHKDNWRTVKTISLVLFEAIKERLIEEAQKIQKAREAQEDDEIQVAGSLLPQEKAELVPEDMEEIDLPSSQPLTEKERLKLQIGSDLPGQIVRLNHVSKILAVAAADEGVRDFEEIYNHRLTTGINRVTSNQMAKVCKAIDDLQNSDNGDFLQSVGKNRNLQSSDLDAGMNLLLNKIK